MRGASSISSTSASIAWTTNVATTSQVEFGTTPAYGLTTGIDPNPTANHRVVLRGLTPGTLYYFRARSLDAAGRLAESASGSFATAARARAPAIDDVGPRRVTATTALLEWTASSSVAQVEYGTTSAYGLFTLLRSYPATAQEMLLTDLRPRTEYHFRIKTWNSAGDATVSDDFTFTTAPAQVATVLGENTVYPDRQSLAVGQIKAFQFAAEASGVASAVPVYIDASSTATSLALGLYADRGGKPGALLSQATLNRATAGAWNQLMLRPTNLVQGMSYWLAVLNPTTGSGTLVLRGGEGPRASLMSAPRIHSVVPLTWVSEVAPRGGAISAYVQQLVPAVTLTGPADGATVAGNVTVSATVDGDAPVSGVQFMVDDQPVGAVDRVAPYSFVWNSTTATTHDFHSFSARATDARGRVGVAAPVSAHVDNGAVISQVTAIAVGPTSTWVSWSTDAPTDAEVEFGTTTAYGRSTAVDPVRSWQHYQLLTGLEPNTTYHYRVRSRDQRGVLAISADHTFTTAADAP